MKGAVFIAFNEMVEEQIGIDTWERLLNEVNPESEGIYTSVEDYPDSELFALVGKLSEIVNIPIPTLVESFGFFLFTILNSKCPHFSEQETDFFGFIKSIDDVIHREVRKLYENPNLPHLECKDINPNELEVLYQSPRKLCFLAEGLIRGAARHYNVEYTLRHDKCMHDGHDHCLFYLTT